MVGSMPIRGADCAVIFMDEPAQLIQDVKCYDPRNPRHTTRELAKYIQASKRTFSDCCPSFFHV